MRGLVVGFRVDNSEGGGAAGVQAQPSGFWRIHTDWNKEGVVMVFERQRGLGWCRGVLGKDAEFGGGEINLDDAVAKKIRSEEAIDVAAAGIAKGVQVDGKVIAREGEGVEGQREVLWPVARLQPRTSACQSTPVQSRTRKKGTTRKRRSLDCGAATAGSNSSS